MAKNYGSKNYGPKIMGRNYGSKQIFIATASTTTASLALLGRILGNLLDNRTGLVLTKKKILCRIWLQRIWVVYFSHQ